MIQRFEILEELGRGGMGAVYRARDPQLQRDVAIKVLAMRTEPIAELSRALATVRTLDLRSRPTANDDLLAEARVMAQLSHPNVLPVFEVGLDAGEVFLVMEHVAGLDLRAWLQTRPTAAAIREVFRDAGHGLAAAHARGIVHRDFKPDNVLVGDDGRVRVADFGLSLLVRPTASAIRYDDQAGTPEYMAPEQLAGRPATDRTDVYAFARSLAEAWIGRRVEVGEIDQALRDAGVPAPARSAIAAALGDDPARRPAMAALVAALAPTPPRRRGRAVVAAAIALTAFAGTTAAVMYLWSHGDPGAICEPARVAAEPAELVRALGPPGSPQARELAALIERRAGELAEARRAACDEQARGDATQAQVRVRQSCLDRRAIELSAIAHGAAAAPPDRLRALGDRAYLVTAAACRELTLAPLPADPRAQVALIDRLLQTADLPVAQRLAGFPSIERDAAAIGEPEIAARAALFAGFALKESDRVSDAIAAFQRSYRIASSIHATDVAIRALVDNANTTSSSGDVAGARQLAMLALDLADHPGASDWNRARALLAVGRMLLHGGDYAAAIDRLEQGRAALAHTARPNTLLESALRTDQLSAMLGLWDRRAAALDLARDNLDYLRGTDGVRSVAYSIGLDGLSRALYENGQSVEALQRSRESLATLLELRPPDHSFVIRQRGKVASLAIQLGEFREAGDEYRAALAASDTNEALRDDREDYLSGLAEAEYGLGHHEAAMRLLQQSIEESISAHGRDHPTTLNRMAAYAEYALDLGRLDDAAARYAVLEAGYRKQRGAPETRLAIVRGTLGSRIALAQRRPIDAEALARDALPAVDQPGAAADRAWIRHALGASLVAQRRWRDALDAAEASLADGRLAALREDYLAMFDLTWAQAAFELGRTAEALTRARSAAAVLARFPGQRSASTGAAAVVQRLARARSAPRR